MRTNPAPRLGAVAAGAASLALVTACGGDDPFEEDGEPAGDGEQVVVGSSDFPESTLLGNIYAQALEAAGVDVETQFDIGSREVYFDQVTSGELSVFPEYNGGILFYLDSEAEAGDTDTTNADVEGLLPDGLEILDSSPAENKDSLTVRADTAEEEELSEISDLEPLVEDYTLGAPAEFESRPQGVPGLESTYGLTFGGFSALEAALIPQALSEDDVQVANLFTTEPAITINDFVVLDDPENLFGSQNVTPLVHAESVDDTVRQTLNEVSAQLTTEDLSALNERVSIDHDDPDAVAADWLESVGLN